jgi:hypothetical protein
MPIAMPILAAFITPGIFYLGAAATSIPIIIHLLNKRRFKVVIWAAMDFLLAAQRRNARRMQLHRWLLLALRCLALLILAAAIAQFFLGSSLIGSIMGGERAVIIIWDDSYAMGYRREPRLSHYETSRKLLKDYLASPSVSSSDKIALISGAGGVGSRLIDKPTLDHGSVRRAIESHEITDQPADLANAFDKAYEALKDVEQTARSRSVIIITELSRSSLRGAADTGDEAARQVLKRKIETLRALADVRVVDVGEADQNNRAIVALHPVRSALVAGMPAELNLSVFNATDSALLDYPVTLSVDGVVVSTEKLPRIGPGDTLNTRVAVTLATPGHHMIEARLAGDLLPLDDVRRLAVTAARELPVLLVDGNPGDNRTLGSTTFLQLALAPEAGSIFAPHTITELELPRTPLGAGVDAGGQRAAYAAVVLSDTGKFDPATLKNLQRYVNDGGLLVIFPGGRTNANDLNGALGSNGIQVLAAPFGQPVHPESGAATTGDATGGEGLHLDPQNYSHPILTAFASAARAGKVAGLSSVQVSTYLRLQVPQDPAIETILKFSDGNAAVISRKVGKGRVMQFAFSADTSWSSFPARPSYVPFVWELLFYGMARPTDALTLEPGAALRLPADAAPAGLWNAPRNNKLSVTTTVDEERRGWLTSPPLAYAGVYGPAGAPALVAVNPDPRGADIRHLQTADMAAALGISPRDIVSQPRALDASSTTSNVNNAQAGELGRKLLLAALAVFTAEAVLAALFSRYR